MKKEFTLSIENAGGPIQLILMSEVSGTGRRLLGSKGSPHKDIIKEWKLTKEELNTLVYEMKAILEESK